MLVDIPVKSVVATVFERQPFLPDLRREVSMLARQMAGQLQSGGYAAGRIAVVLAPVEGVLTGRAERTPLPTADIGLITVVAQDLLDSAYEPGVQYREVLIVCDNLASDDGSLT